MKFYKATFYDRDLGALLSWHTSVIAAKKHLQTLQQERDTAGREATGPEGVEQVDVPTTKAELLRWLNSNVTTDNG